MNPAPLPPDADLNLLRRASPAHVCWEPYPHLVIEDALDESVYALLESTYPDESIIRSAKQVHHRDQLQAFEGLTHPDVHPVWRAFMRWHVSSDFYQQWARLFQPWISALYPWLEVEKDRPLADFTCGLRDPGAAVLPDVCLDCQPGLNHLNHTPVSYRSAHLDAANKLLTGLFYMRLPGDDATGGDFQLHRLLHPQPQMDSPTTIPEDQLEVVKTIPYRRNTAVFFLNSPVSIHGVSVRNPTPVPRRLVNLVAGLYTLKNRTLYPSPPSSEDFASTRFSPATAA
jgi:hypothetical protein